MVIDFLHLFSSSLTLATEHESEADFLQSLAIIMLVAGVVTLFCHKLRQPVVLGYLIAGMIVGPNFSGSLGLAKINLDTIKLLADLGLVFLMFSVGLSFSIHRLFKVGGTALIAATLEVTLLVWLGYQVGKWFGWEQTDRLFLGAIMAVSSTTIIVKNLRDMGQEKERHGQIILGLLVLEDILGIGLIALLSAVSVKQQLQVDNLVKTMAWLAVFLAGVVIVGLLAVPRLLNFVSRFKSSEMLLITSLGLCFGVSLLAIKLGYSVALGAFIIGAIMAESRQRGRLEVLVDPLRDAFSAVFFVSAGMLINLAMLGANWAPTIVTIIAVVVGNIVAVSIATFIAGENTRTALKAGIGMAQIGEFSFVIAQLGNSTHMIGADGKSTSVTSEFIYPITVTVCGATALISPYLIRNSDRIIGVFERIAPQGMIHSLGLYHHWINQEREESSATKAVRSIFRRAAIQIFVNIALIAGVFGTAAGLRPWLVREVKFFHDLPHEFDAAGSMMWMAAMLISLPLIIATLRKVRAMGALLAEMSVAKTAAGSHTVVIRTVLTNTILIFVTVTLMLFVLVLSTAILEPGPVMVVLLAITIGVAIFKWRDMVNVYSKAQVALEETLKEDEEDEQQPVPTTPADDTEIRLIPLDQNSLASGRLIREMAVRSTTGATIVAIERGKSTIFNPGPDEEMLAGDSITIMGRPAQLDAAIALITKA